MYKKFFSNFEFSIKFFKSVIIKKKSGLHFVISAPGFNLILAPRLSAPATLVITECFPENLFIMRGRDDPNSRQNTIKHIVERSDPARDWQQVLIFPEGTCTNRSCLITFRTGAFVPGVAVQPVIIRWGHPSFLCL
jgi:hypothetical protein